MANTGHLLSEGVEQADGIGAAPKHRRPARPGASLPYLRQTNWGTPAHGQSRIEVRAPVWVWMRAANGANDVGKVIINIGNQSPRTASFHRRPSGFGTRRTG